MVNQNALELKSLSKSFGNFKAVDNLSVSVKQGEIFSLLGPNGAGKTTAINMITGVLEMDDGTIEMNGVTYQKGGSTRGGMIGVCTQELQLWPFMTCEEQLHFMGNLYKLDTKVIKKRSLSLLEMVGLSDKRKVWAKKLSGGMQRRLHLIMSVIHDPDIVILDEPEAGLDPQSRILVRDFIKFMSKSKTILLTTHNMDEAERLSSRVAIMDKGKVLVCDTPTMLRQRIAPEETMEILYEQPVVVTEQWKSVPYKVQVNDKTIRVTGNRLAAEAPNILSKMSSLCGDPVTVSLRQSTLEDVFIKLTGRSLRE
ncbi:ABC transporter ATP-binding protein [Paenibacillus sp. FSL K6-2524]|uniref:ABC transporter ATP-binding protein n=1 Tax=Paenibacillus sp. FSL K6-2524 TaxID=2954516 RepID=UPI0030F624C9